MMEREWLVLGLGGGLVAKIVWDWLKAGRMNKHEHMTIAACQRHQADCDIKQLKNDFTRLQENAAVFKVEANARLKLVEKRLEEGAQTFKELRDLSAGIKDDLTAIKLKLEICEGKSK